MCNFAGSVGAGLAVGVEFGSRVMGGLGLYTRGARAKQRGGGDNVAMAFTVAADPKLPPAPALQADLHRRLRKLARVFDLPALRRQSLGAPEVVAYYENCHDAYRKYHSAEGAVHMALNDGDSFDPDGFYGQLRLMERGWATPPADLLELAFGQGFNLAYLAQRHPNSQFSGIDFTPAHVRIAGQRLQREGLTRVTLTEGDFHQLPYADASFDAVFCIESFCHAMNLPQALGEVARVLRPGGRFTLFDGYLSQPAAQLGAEEALAVELVARGMAIESLQLPQDLLAAAQDVGLKTTRMDALDAQVLPSLRRLERTTGAIIRFPWLGRWALARRHPARGRNVLAGYLLRSALQMGLLCYRHIELQKDTH